MLEPRIQQHFFESADLSYQAAESMARPIADAAQAIVDCVTAGGRIWVHGRGVAQAPAQLLGAALSGRFERERPGLAAMVLAVDALLLSEARESEADAPAVTQLRVLGQAGDVLVAFSLRPDDALLAAVVAAAHEREMSALVIAGREPGGGSTARPPRPGHHGRDRHLDHRPARAPGAHLRTPTADAACPVRCRRPPTTRRRRPLMTMHTTPLSQARRRHPLVTTVVVGALALASLASLQGCVLLLGAGAVAGGMSLNDRRTSGTQIEDQSIELKSGGRIREAIGDKGHINVTSYNRIALVTGEVPADADKAAIEKAIAGIEGVTNVVNELEVGANSTISTRSSDTVITTRVKSALIDAKDLQSSAVKVVTERGNVYLMGRVTEREAVRATEIARAQPSVMKVVRVFEILTEEQLGNLK